MFQIILKFLTKQRVTAILLINSRLILGVMAILIYQWFGRYTSSYNLLFIAMVLGFLAQALSLYQKTDNDHQVFLNVLVDYILYTFLLLLVSVIASNYKQVVYNLFIIPILYLLVTIKKFEFKPSNWLIKIDARVGIIKNLVVVAFFSHWYFGTTVTWLNYSLILVNVLATIVVVYCGIFIELRWKKLNLE